MAAIVSSAAAQNVLSNPGFEADDASSVDVPGASGWFSFENAFTTQTVTPNSGAQSMKLFGPFFNGGASGVGQGGFAANPGELWAANAFVRNDSSDPIGDGNFAVTKIEFLDAGNNVVGFAESAQFNNSFPQDVWLPLGTSGIAPAGTTSAQIVLVHVQLDPITGGSVFFDDASLIPEPASLSLLSLAAVGLLRRR